MAQLWYGEVSNLKDSKGNEKDKGNKGKTKMQRKPDNQRTKQWRARLRSICESVFELNIAQLWYSEVSGFQSSTET